MNIPSLLGACGRSLRRWLILALAAVGIAGNADVRGAQPVTTPNAGGEVEPRYLLFWRAPEQAPELIRQIGGKGDGRSRILGFGIPIAAFDEEKQLAKRVHTAFATARAHDLAVMPSFDFHVHWRSRPDLWNWFDTNQPGYKAANRRNVEWLGWDGPPAKTRYLNWGGAERPMPSPTADKAELAFRTSAVALRAMARQATTLSRSPRPSA